MSAETIEVDPTNREQLAAWNGDEGAYWSAKADYFDRSIAAYHAPFMEAARIGRSDRVLDIGCGAGQTTLDAARQAPAGSVLGVDLSDQLLEVARQRAAAAGVTNVSFLQADAQIQPFEPASFDVAISRTGAMFFGDHGAAFANVRAALRAGGRLVLLSWQPLAANEWLQAIATSLAAGREPRIPPPGMGPFSLSQPEAVRDLLGRAGFDEVEFEGREAPMWFGADADDAHAFILGVAGWMLEGLDDAARAEALDALRATTTAHASPAGVMFGSGAWTITATARPARP